MLFILSISESVTIRSSKFIVTYFKGNTYQNQMIIMSDEGKVLLLLKLIYYNTVQRSWKIL